MLDSHKIGVSCCGVVCCGMMWGRVPLEEHATGAEMADLAWTTAPPAGDGTGDGWYYLRQRDGYTTIVCVDTSANGRNIGTFIYRVGLDNFSRVADESPGSEWYGPLPLPTHPMGVWDSYHLPDDEPDEYAPQRQPLAASEEF